MILGGGEEMEPRAGQFPGKINTVVEWLNKARIDRSFTRGYYLN